MKSIEEIIKNYKDYGTFIDDRFGRRFIQFLTVKQCAKIGFEIKEEYIEGWEVKDWTRDNILKQLEQDVRFGWEKASNERGISSSLMFEVVKSWNKVLQEGLENYDEYDDYGKSLFIATAEKYGWEL